MASSNIARLGVVLACDTAEFTASVNKAIEENNKLKRAIQRDSDAAAKEIIALKYAIEDYGKEVSKVTLIEREIAAGRYQNATPLFKTQLLEMAKAYDQVAVSQKKVQAGLSDQQKLALTYQTTDFVTQIVSGQNAMIALLQQGGQLKDQLGGIGNTFKIIGGLLTPIRLAIGGLVTVFGTLAYAAYAGRKEFDQLVGSLALTGKYAGISTDEFYKMSEKLAISTKQTVGNAKEVLMAVISSGSVAKQAVGPVAEAVLTISKLSGETAKDVASKLIPAFDGTASSAKRLNDQYNFLTLAQYKHIEQLEREGKWQQNAAETADLLNESKKKLRREFGLLEQIFDAVQQKASKMWNAILGIGRPSSIADRIKEVEDEIGRITEGGTKEPGSITYSAGRLKQLRDLLPKLREELKRQNQEEENAAKEKEKIRLRAEAGGLAKERQLQRDAQKQEMLNDIERKKKEATEIGKIELDAEAEIQSAKFDLAKKNEEERGVFATLNAQNYRELVDKIMLESDKKISDVRKKRYADELKAWEELRDETAKDRAAADTAYENQIKAINDKITLENISLQNDQKKLELQQQGLFMSEKEQKLMMLDLELAQQIAEIKRTLPDNADRDNVIKRLTDQNELKKGLVNVTDAFQKMKEMSDSVWNNMSNALENFVRTGKLSFKDLARSIIQDLILIQLKAQMLSIFRFIGGAFFGTPGAGGVDYSLPTTGVKFGGPKAAGGSVSSSQAYLVGEQGPELFMPRSAGTIVPNSQLGMGTTNVTNNYINAIDVKSFEQRLLSSSNAVWAANAYAQKSLAVGRGRS